MREAAVGRQQRQSRQQQDQAPMASEFAGSPRVDRGRSKTNPGLHQVYQEREGTEGFENAARPGVRGKLTEEKSMKGLGTVLVGAAAALSLAGCIVIGSSAISEKTGNGTAISTHANDMGILRLAIPQDLTQKANSDLLSQCKSGKLTDVQTELTMRDFLIVQLYDISVAAVCE
jgi:hypothetical protein